MNNKSDKNPEIKIDQQQVNEIKVDRANKDAVQWARIRHKLGEQGLFSRIDRSNFNQ